MNRYLSENFSWREMIHTTHRELINDNRIQAEADIRLLLNARALCRTVLQPIRDLLGPVVIHSGFRSPKLNVDVGGSVKSQHMDFEAADFHVLGMGVEEAYSIIRAELIEKDVISVGQYILEGHASWIHISLGYPWRDAQKNGQVMTINNTADNKSASGSFQTIPTGLYLPK